MEQALVDRNALYENYTAYLNLLGALEDTVERQLGANNAVRFNTDPESAIVMGGLATYHTKAGIQYEHNIALTAQYETDASGNPNDNFTGFTLHTFQAGGGESTSIALFGRNVRSEDPFISNHNPDLLRRTDMMSRKQCDFYARLFSHDESYSQRGAQEALRFLHARPFLRLYGDALARFRLARESSKNSDQQQSSEYSH